MANAELIAYIQAQLSTGRSREEIFQVLADKGWPLSVMEAAFRLASLNLQQAAGKSSQDKHAASGFWPELTTYLLFRIGFASIFLINALIAWLKPSDFTQLLENNVVFNLIGHESLLVKLIGANDFILGLLILFKPSRYVFLWAAAWLFGVTCLKALNLAF